VSIHGRSPLQTHKKDFSHPYRHLSRGSPTLLVNQFSHFSILRVNYFSSDSGVLPFSLDPPFLLPFHLQDETQNFVVVNNYCLHLCVHACTHMHVHTLNALNIKCTVQKHSVVYMYVLLTYTHTRTSNIMMEIDKTHTEGSSAIY